MNQVFVEWARRLLVRASLIQVLALALVAILDGAERAAVGEWTGWLPNLFILHLHGLGFYFGLAALWLDRDWRLGGERQALAVAGRSGRELVAMTVVLGALWTVVWGGAGGLVQSAMVEDGPRWIQTSESTQARFVGGERWKDLVVRVEGAKVVEVLAQGAEGRGLRWSGDASGRWVGATNSADVQPIPSVTPRSSTVPLTVLVLLGQCVLVGAAGGLSLWAGARYAWLAVLGIALVGLLSMGINSAVIRGYWGTEALGLLPAVAVLLLLASWQRDPSMA